MQLLVNNWAFREYPFNDTVTSYQLISLPVEFSKLWFYATLSIPQLSKSFHAPVPTFQKCVAGIKFRMTMYIYRTTIQFS